MQSRNSWINLYYPSCQEYAFILSKERGRIISHVGESITKVLIPGSHRWYHMYLQCPVELNLTKRSAWHVQCCHWIFFIQHSEEPIRRPCFKQNKTWLIWLNCVKPINFLCSFQQHSTENCYFCNVCCVFSLIQLNLLILKGNLNVTDVI